MTSEENPTEKQKKIKQSTETLSNPAEKPVREKQVKVNESFSECEES